MANKRQKQPSKGKSLNPIAVQSYLKGMSYPARKQDIIDCGHENEAPAEIMEAIEKIADKDYNTPAELTREIGTQG